MAETIPVEEIGSRVEEVREHLKLLADYL